MARRPKGIDTSRLLRNLMKTDKYVETIAARRGAKLSRNIRKMAAKQKDKQAEEKYAKQRDKGLNMNQLINCCPPNIVDNSIRDSVSVVVLKMSKDRQRVSSKTLTYDNTTGVLKVRPHKHTVDLLFTSGEHIHQPFYKAKKLSVNCDCEWFQYYCEYALAKRFGASDVHFSNGEYPEQTNPSLNPQICKHLVVLLKLMRARKI